MGMSSMSLHKSTKGTIVLATGFDRRGCFDGVCNTQLKPIINHCVWFPCVLSAGLPVQEILMGFPRKTASVMTMEKLHIHTTIT